MTRAVFLDRDGVVNDLVYYPSHREWESPRTLDDLKVRPEAGAQIRLLNESGWLVFLITNQPSYAKGKCSLEELQQVHARVLETLRKEGAEVTESYVCYHHPQAVVPQFGACECRKPSPFFIRQAAAKYGIDLASAWMAGDQETDIQTGRAAGCRTALIKYEQSMNKRGSVTPDLICDDLADFVRKITNGS